MKFSFIKASFVAALSILILFSSTNAQEKKEPRKSLSASVSQTIGLDVVMNVEYSRPGVKGRKIFGELVPLGMEPGNKYSDNKAYPWRGGANESTKFEVSSDILVEGKTLPAGKYSLHFIPSESEWTVIFNKDIENWGSYKYDQEKDALRVMVLPKKDNHQEWLTYGFEDLDGYNATFFLHWDNLKVPLKIESKK